MFAIMNSVLGRTAERSKSQTQIVEGKLYIACKEQARNRWDELQRSAELHSPDGTKSPALEATLGMFRGGTAPTKAQPNVKRPAKRKLLLHLPMAAGTYTAVSTNSGSILWCPLQWEPYYLETPI